MGLGPEHLYTAAKGALLSLTRSLAVEYGKYNIRFNIVCPGTTETEIWEPLKRTNPAVCETLGKLCPLGRYGESIMTQWYETLFANFGKTYDKECFTQGTVGEVDFVEQELGGDRSKRILDIACGTGRHAIELAKRGYCVIGFDLSEGQLRRGTGKGGGGRCVVDFQCRDATQPHFDQEFDAAIMFCEGAFSLMETDREELRHSQTRRRGVASRRQIAADNAQCLVSVVSLRQGFS